MKIRINFFAEPSEPNVLIACPTGDFASLEEARPIALADGNKPAIMAHSIIIESLDDASLSSNGSVIATAGKVRMPRGPKGCTCSASTMPPIKRWQMRPTFFRQVPAVSVARGSEARHAEGS